jgi:hypothetical protein
MHTLVARALPAVALAALGINAPSLAGETADPARYAVGTVSMSETRALRLHFFVWDRHSPKPVDLTIAPTSRSYRDFEAVTGDIQPGQTKPLPPWNGYIGVVARADDKTIVYYARSLTNEGDAIFESVFPAGNALGELYAKQAGGLEAGESKLVPSWPENVGTASMAADGTITLHLRSDSSGIIAETVQTYRPGDPLYAQVLQHVWDIDPGEPRPIPPWR